MQITSVESHARWKAKLGIPHPLLADTDHAVAERYGVWVEETRPDGSKHWGVARTTFLIDEKGKVFKRQACGRSFGNSTRRIKLFPHDTTARFRGVGNIDQRLACGIDDPGINWSFRVRS